MTDLPNLSHLSHDEKDALIRALWAQVQTLTAPLQILTARMAELEPGSAGRRRRRTIRPCRRRRARRLTARISPSVKVRAKAAWVAKVAGER